MTSKIGLLRSSSEESFEHIDPDFDGSYFPELHAVALANYIPLEKEEILLKKGEKTLTIASGYCLSYLYMHRGHYIIFPCFL